MNPMSSGKARESTGQPGDTEAAYKQMRQSRSAAFRKKFSQDNNATPNRQRPAPLLQKRGVPVTKDRIYKRGGVDKSPAGNNSASLCHIRYWLRQTIAGRARLNERVLELAHHEIMIAQVMAIISLYSRSPRTS